MVICFCDFKDLLRFKHFSHLGKSIDWIVLNKSSISGTAVHMCAAKKVSVGQILGECTHLIFTLGCVCSRRGSFYLFSCVEYRSCCVSGLWLPRLFRWWGNGGAAADSSSRNTNHWGTQQNGERVVTVHLNNISSAIMLVGDETAAEPNASE